MKPFFRFLSFNTLLILALACKKDPVPPIIIPPIPPVVTGPVQYETPFADVPATADMVLYEINERAFSASGNLAGILPRLDSIKALGVNTIWLMPIHPIGVTKTVNSPYCVTNFKEVNPEFGTLEDLRTLVREAHKRKMAVIMDWVANHTSWDNPWTSNKAWYSQDASGNIIHPAGTNWQDVADLNFDNDEMRLEMIKALKYWLLVANVDGYRCDAADFVPYSFWKQAIDSMKLIPNRKLILLAEGGKTEHFDAGFQLNFGWDFFNKNKDVFKNNKAATGYYTTHQSEYNQIKTGTQKLRFTSNHDECAWDNTPLVLFGGKNASMAAFVLSAYMGGVPLIYNGQEVACSVKLPFFSRSPIDWTTNPDIFKQYKTLMSLRAAHSALRTGDLVSYADNDVAAFKRKSGTDEVLVVVNTRAAAKSFIIPAALQNTVWQDAVSGAKVQLDSPLSLNGFEYRILIK
jgi:glycosidase